MAGHAALASGLARFLARPLVRRALRVCRLPSLAGDLALLLAVHRGESAILSSHSDLLYPLRWAPPQRDGGRTFPAAEAADRNPSGSRKRRAATDVPRLPGKTAVTLSNN